MTSNSETRGFMAAGLSPQITHLLLVDYDAAVVRYNQINIALLRAAQNRQDYLWLRLTASRLQWLRLLEIGWLPCVKFCIGAGNHRMGSIDMKQPTKRELSKLKKIALKEDSWEEVDGFHATKPTSIRLSSQLIKGLEKIAHLRGERSYQTLLKRWVAERVEYEMELIQLARHKKAV